MLSPPVDCSLRETPVSCARAFELSLAVTHCRKSLQNFLPADCLISYVDSSSSHVAMQVTYAGNTLHMDRNRRTSAVKLKVGG